MSGQRKKPGSRKPLKRSALARGEFPLKRKGELQRSQRGGARQTRARISHEQWLEAKKRSDGRCVQCDRHCLGQAHHVLPRRLFPECADEVRNLVYVCPGCHDEHERAHRRIRLGSLPSCCFEVAAEVGDRALSYIQQTYPSDAELW